MNLNPHNKSKADIAVETAQFVVLTYSTAVAVEGLYRMAKNGLIILDSKIASRNLDVKASEL
jgi:hypothetical protein